MINTFIALIELVFKNIKNNDYQNDNQVIILKKVEFEEPYALIYWAQYEVNFYYRLRVETINDDSSKGFDESELDMISPNIIDYSPFEGEERILQKEFIAWAKIVGIEFNADSLNYEE